MRIASWNIAGGHTVKSTGHFDYNPEDTSYFSDQLAELEPDVICLQETHTNEKRSVAAEIARELGGYHVFNSPLSPSHVDPAYKLGMAILTRKPFANERLHMYPSPEFELFFASSGRKAIEHKKALQTVDYDGMQVANTHMLPLIIFGYDYREGRGKELAGKIERVIENNLSDRGVLCGDFGMSNGQFEVYRELMKKFQLENALPEKPTYHDASPIGGLNAPDCMFYTAGTLEVVDSGVVTTNTDHYLCWAEVKGA